MLKGDTWAGITVFLMADAVLAAKAGQRTPDGYYNVQRLLKRVLASSAKLLLCGTCMDASGLDDATLMGGARRGSTPIDLAVAAAMRPFLHDYYGNSPSVRVGHGTWRIDLGHIAPQRRQYTSNKSRIEGGTVSIRTP